MVAPTVSTPPETTAVALDTVAGSVLPIAKAKSGSESEPFRQSASTKGVLLVWASGAQARPSSPVWSADVVRLLTSLQDAIFWKPVKPANETVSATTTPEAEAVPYWSSTGSFVLTALDEDEGS